MKLKAINYLFLFVILFGINAYSQNFSSEDVNSKIVKSWTVSENIINGKTYKKESLETMDFKSNGELILSKTSKKMGNITMDAKWNFDIEKQKIFLTLEMGGNKEIVALNIKELSDIKLILSSPQKETIYIPTIPKN